MNATEGRSRTSLPYLDDEARRLSLWLTPRAGPHAFCIVVDTELGISLGLFTKPVKRGATEMRMSLEFLDQHGICRLVQIAESILHFHDRHAQLRMTVSERPRVGQNRSEAGRKFKPRIRVR